MTKTKLMMLLTVVILGTGAVKGFEPTGTTEVETAMKANPKPKKGRTISLWGHVRNSLTLQGVLEGYDLLHQLSNVYSSYNAQGRTETWYNTVPSYVMLHLTYKLNVMPKKR